MLRKVTKWWKKGGFTLIELLVVIAIIGILAGFLLPAVTSARKRAQSAKCINNLHQMVLAIRTYTMDYNESFPKVKTSTDLGAQNLDPLYSRYLSTYDLAKCPSSTSAVPTTSWSTGDYAYNTKGGATLTESDSSDTYVLGDDAIVVGNSSAKHSDPKPYNVARHDGSVATIGAGTDLTNAMSALNN